MSKKSETIKIVVPSNVEVEIVKEKEKLTKNSMDTVVFLYIETMDYHALYTENGELKTNDAYSFYDDYMSEMEKPILIKPISILYDSDILESFVSAKDGFPKKLSKLDFALISNQEDE